MNIEKIQEHYDHAREKHSYFCDRILPPEAYQPTKDYALKELQSSLLGMRKELKDAVQKGECSAFEVAACEWLEFLEAVMMGNHVFAIEECYDTIAVLLRVIDVLEGRQKLGKPNEGASNESLSDIETELRTLSQSSKYCELQPTVSGKLISFYFAEIAARIKAAAKRECSTQNPENCVERNSAAMREALKNLTRFEESDIRQLETLAQRAIDNDIYGGGILQAITEAIREGKAALAAPAEERKGEEK